MPKDKAGKQASQCSTCGTNSTCQVCGGSGHWASKPEVSCTHCNGSGSCPIN
jgi:hypothetical protein